MKARILVACEESQTVTIAFRNLGYEAYSCDLLPCSGGHPEWHLRQNVLPLMFKGGFFSAMIAFPPCTHLCGSGARWWKEKREDGRQQAAIRFVMSLAMSPIRAVAIENPVGILSSVWRKPDQIIQPWQFGHGETKATCLWLRGFPILRPTNIVEGREARIHKMAPSADRSRIRSKTYTGIAEAMADQWGSVL